MIFMRLLHKIEKNRENVIFIDFRGHIFPQKYRKIGIFHNFLGENENNKRRVECRFFFTFLYKNA